ncbi:MAG TPA: S41 family peptidase [Terriglobales bacterium]|nr:S41 family peptidase [Terriglobales bacterium]
MKRFRCVLVVLAIMSWIVSVRAQLTCSTNDPTGYFEGTATSQQAGKLEVSLNLRCDARQYAGELVTPVGTYSLKNGRFEKGELHLTLAAGADTVTVDATYNAESLRGKFASGDDGGPIELRRTGEAKGPSAGETVTLTKQQWHEDLAFLARELPKRHANAFHFISRESFAAAVAELDAKLDRLNPDEIYVGMDHIANLIGDGHTYVRVPKDRANFPIDLERFGNDYRVIAATAAHQNLLGTRVINIQDTPAARARELLLSVTPQDETQVLRDSRVTGFMTMGIFLHGLDIIPDRNTAHYTVADDSGKEISAYVHAVRPEENSKINWVYAFHQPPLFRQRPDEHFWYTYLPEARTVYCSFRGYEELGKNSKGLFELIQREHPDKLVIDMRLNGGGDYDEGLKYIVHPIRDLAEINRKGHLFVLIGPNTFSAAMSNAAHFRYQTNAILVGQQIGEKPNSYQEAREFQLPNSHWTVRYSVKFYKFVEKGDNVIRPDKEIIPTWHDYKSGRDPVLQWVLNYGNVNGSPKP